MISGIENVCKNCGAALDPRKEQNGVLKCDYCGSAYVMPKRETEPAALAALRTAYHEMDMCAFDRAYAAFRKAAQCDESEPEAFMGMALAAHEVQYIKDVVNNRLQPICHKVTDKAFTKDPNYLRALSLATREQKEQYESEGQSIDRVRKEFASLQASGLDYDCFLCVKVTGEDGKPTQDSHDALRIYNYLKNKGYKPFYSEEEIGSRTGADYEALILYALCTSPCMLVICHDEGYLHTPWVKNEYTRFLHWINDENKDSDAVTIVFGGEPIEHLPGKDGKIQGIDLSKPDAYVRISDYVERHAAKSKKPTAATEKFCAVCGSANASAAKFCSECGNKTFFATQQEYLDNKKKEALAKEKAKRKKKVPKKAIAAIVAVIVAVVAAGGIAGGVLYNNSVKEVAAVQEYIDMLPEGTVSNYEAYEKIMDEAYRCYYDLSEGQRKKIQNADRLFTLLEGFNAYRVEALRSAMSQISEDTVATSDALKNTATLYGKFTSEQKALLNADERTAAENYVRTYDVVFAIEDVNSNPVDKIGEADGIRRNYLSLPETYRALVYNYGLLDSLTEQAEFLRKLKFTAIAAGYAVSIADTAIAGEITLPSSYRGLPVAEIPDKAFENCSSLTGVTVPDSITQIGDGAFKGCNKLVNITLPFIGKSMTAQGKEAVFGYIFGMSDGSYGFDAGTPNDRGFVNKPYNDEYTKDNAVWQYTEGVSGQYWRYYARYFYIPSTLRTVTITKQEEIPDAAFNGCSNIEQIAFDATLTQIGDAAMQNCAALNRWNSDKDGAADLSGNITKISDRAFYGCEKITSLILAENVTYIGAYAFQGLRLMTSLAVPDSVTQIADGAFNGCNKLADITLPFVGKSMNAQGKEAVLGYIFGMLNSTNGFDAGTPNDRGFVNKTYNEEYTKNNAVWQYTEGVSGQYWRYYPRYFYIPSTLRTVHITKQDVVPDAAFNGCSYIEQITFDAPLTQIYDAAVQNCTSLVRWNSDTDGTAELEGDIQSIGEYAFNGSESIVSVVMQQGITQIGKYAFQGLRLMTDITVPDSVTQIGDSTFKGCNKLVNITLPFVGKSMNAQGKEAVLGYIFGMLDSSNGFDSGTPNDRGFVNKPYNNEYTKNNAVWQYTEGVSGQYWRYYPRYFYIPSTLRTVTITKQEAVPDAAFNGCDMLTEVVYSHNITSTGDAAFQNCVQPKIAKDNGGDDDNN